jgi:hypothetical protein
MGYEDLNDHEELRHDLMFAIALGKRIGIENEPVILAGKSTLNRLEHCPEDVEQGADSRYHKIGHSPSEIESLFVKIFLESYSKEPRQIILDLDVTDDLVHGTQEQVFFNTYYAGYCYAPLYIFCGKHLLAAKLRPSNVDPAAGALEELQRVIKLVTSITTNKMAPGELYTQKYCPRGEMENRFKEQQLELFSDRTSTHTFAGNQLRLWFSSIAYVLMNSLRSKCLAKTELQNAQVGTIRTKLLKLGALITVSARRILIAISSSSPSKHIWANAYRCLKLLSNTA